MSRASFSAGDGRRIAAAVREIEGARRHKPGVGMGKGATVGGEELVLAKITGNLYLARHDIAIGGGSVVDDVEVAWKYAWTEVRRAADGTFPAVEDGRSGTTGEGWAINLAEWGHNGQYAWGVDLTAESYPLGFRPRPVGGGGGANTHRLDQVVEMHAGRNTDGTAYWWFDRFGSHDGSCT